MKIFFLLLLIAHPIGARAENPAPEQLAQAMGDRITRVPEFAFIRQEAEKLGVRVYLFGGTAAAYGHYIRQDLAREAGDKRYPDFLYDYDYTNIFRSTQDLDVVIDGSSEKAKELEDILKSKYPHFVGDKEAKWEVRPLNEARGDKEAILKNPDFQNQHTDSHSTGLVEITKPSKGESAVKDVRDWNAKASQFLRDVAEQKLHYYFNPLHETTKRAKERMNPPILSAIRYLTKAFQYDLEISGADREKIQEIIRNFDPKSIKNDYVGKWIEKNGKKLFQHAVDIEGAWKTIDDLGLRKKLIELQHNPHALDSLAWWMSKEPLRTYPLGEGQGATAAELFGKDLTLAHETNSFLAYESITRSKAGDLNALISRQGKEGEVAAKGDGFYTRLGRKGAANTGFTIRMHLDPTAREGTDFAYERELGFVILKNRAAVRVIPEQISLSLPEYFRAIAEGKDFSQDDRALLEAFKRKTAKAGAVSVEDEASILELVRKESQSAKPNRSVLREWFSLPISVKHMEIVGDAPNDKLVLAELMQAASKNRQWQGHEDHLEMLLAGHSLTKYFQRLAAGSTLSEDDQIIFGALKARIEKPGFLSAKEKTTILEIVRAEAAKSLPNESVLREYFTLPLSLRHMDIIDQAASPRRLVKQLIITASESPMWRANEDLLKKYLEQDENVYDFCRYILRSPLWGDKVDWVQNLMDRSFYAPLAEYVLDASRTWANHPEWVRTMLQKGNFDELLAANTFREAAWVNHTDLVDELVNRGHADQTIAEAILEGHAAWLNHKEKGLSWLTQIASRGNHENDTILELAAKSDLPGLEKVLQIILDQGDYDYEFIHRIVSNPRWQKHPEWMMTLIERGEHDQELVPALMGHGWNDYPEIIERLVKKGAVDSALDNFLFANDSSPWAQNPQLKKVVGGGKVNVAGLKKAFEGGFSFYPKIPLPATCAGKFAEVGR